jgi:hypothetical protein
LREFQPKFATEEGCQRYLAGCRWPDGFVCWTVTWAVAVFLANLGNYPLGIFPTRLLVITSIVALVEIVVATLVGAWLYKEEEMQVVHRAAA